MRKVFDPVKNADRHRISIYIVDIGGSKKSVENSSSSPSQPHSRATYTQYRLSIQSDPISTLSITRVNKTLWLLRHAPNSTPEGQAKGGRMESCHCHRAPILSWTFQVAGDGSGPQQPSANTTQVRQVSRVSGKTKRFTWSDSVSPLRLAIRQDYSSAVSAALERWILTENVNGLQLSSSCLRDCCSISPRGKLYSISDGQFGPYLPYATLRVNQTGAVLTQPG